MKTAKKVRRKKPEVMSEAEGKVTAALNDCEQNARDQLEVFFPGMELEEEEHGNDYLVWVARNQLECIGRLRKALEGNEPWDVAWEAMELGMWEASAIDFPGEYQMKRKLGQQEPDVIRGRLRRVHGAEGGREKARRQAETLRVVHAEICKRVSTLHAQKPRRSFEAVTSEVAIKVAKSARHVQRVAKELKW